MSDIMTEKERRSNEYIFSLDGPYHKETFPMAKLAEYLKDLAIIYGQQEDLFFLRLDEGSAEAVAWAREDVQPAIDHQLYLVANNEASTPVMEAFERVDSRARNDRATAKIVNPSGNVIVPFPGCEKIIAPEVFYGPFKQYEVIEGVPITIGGKNQLVSIHIEERDGNQVICQAKRELAKEIARYLFDEPIKIEGMGKWVRHPDGTWERQHFMAHTFEVVKTTTIREDIEAFRAVDGKWKENEDPIRDLDIIRHEGEIQ